MSAATTVVPVQPLAVPPVKAAELLGISDRALRRWRAEGRGPRYVTLGGNKVVYRVSDLESWLESEASK